MHATLAVPSASDGFGLLSLLYFSDSLAPAANGGSLPLGVVAMDVFLVAPVFERSYAMFAARWDWILSPHLRGTYLPAWLWHAGRALVGQTRRSADGETRPPNPPLSQPWPPTARS